MTLVAQGEAYGAPTNQTAKIAQTEAAITSNETGATADRSADQFTCQRLGNQSAGLGNSVYRHERTEARTTLLA